jgi:hypothetical protein
VDKIILNVPKVLSYGAMAFHFVKIIKNEELQHMVTAATYWSILRRESAQRN